ncbi:MAG: CinA family nicotinamide mononucleotide deamidase-related protein [Fimbriimonadaceae bacterium]
MKSAEIVSIGEELLAGMIADTNAQYLGQLLPEVGIFHRHRQTVGDDIDSIRTALQLALSRSDVVLTIGGLGPTEDDRTRLAIANVLGAELETDLQVESELKKLFALRNLKWSEKQAQQAQKPVGSKFVGNPNGTAPGLICPIGGKVIIALPGPKGEFRPMADGPVRDFLSGTFSEGAVATKVLRTCGTGEGHLESLLGDLIHSPNPTIAPYAGLGEVKLRIVATGPNAQIADEMLAAFESKVRNRIGGSIYGEGETELEEAVLGALRDRKQTLATCESMTGGGLAQRLTSVAGASDVFKGGLVTYQAETKALLADVSDNSDPVSAEVAAQLAECVTKATGISATYGLGIAGNAGPTSDRGDKPVGLVFVALAGPGGTVVEQHQFRGLREDVRRRATQAALLMLWRELR